MFHRPFVALAAALLALVSLAVTAEAGRIGDEFHVNTEIEGSQQYSSVARIGTGGFVVVWRSLLAPGGIYAQRYNAGGERVGGEFAIKSDSGSAIPSVAALNDGGFVVIFGSREGSRKRSSIFGRRYNAAGELVGSEFQVTQWPGTYCCVIAVAGLANGGFVVTWVYDGDPATGNYRVRGQRFSAAGVPVGNIFLVGLVGTFYTSVAGLTNGGFVVVVGAAGDIQGQRYNAAGTAVGGLFQINSFAPHHQWQPTVAPLSDGGFIAVWASERDGSLDGVYGRRYSAAGVPANKEFRINSYRDSSQQAPSVAALTTGVVVVTWQSYGQDSFDDGIYGQRYAINGARDGEEFRVNTYRKDHQRNPSVAALDDGSFVVTWSSEQERDAMGPRGKPGDGIYGQRFKR